MDGWVRTEDGDWEVRGIYEVRSRNLLVAVHRGDGEWIGIRQKFDSRYLFTEHSPPGPFGTVTMVGRRLGVLPEPYRTTEQVGRSYCAYCGSAATWTPNQPGGRIGTWTCEEACSTVSPARLPNRPLFDYLDDLEEDRDQG